jgi:hypothetical protein
MPALTLRPLEHGRRPDAAAGRITGLVTPVASTVSPHDASRSPEPHDRRTLAPAAAVATAITPSAPRLGHESAAIVVLGSAEAPSAHISTESASPIGTRAAHDDVPVVVPRYQFAPAQPTVRPEVRGERPISAPPVVAGGEPVVTGSAPDHSTVAHRAPLVGASPIIPSIQRLPLSVPEPNPEPNPAPTPEPNSGSGDARSDASAVPLDLVHAIGHRTGVDLSDVVVHRGPASAEAAEALDAHAFTIDGEIHLPARAGSIERGRGRAILAHELTHVAQQRKLGESLPPENSQAGRALESEAQAAERPAERAVTEGDAAADVPRLGSDEAGSARRRVVMVPHAQRQAATTQAPAGNRDPQPRDLDMDVLAARLYDQMEVRLRSRVIVDRERAGFTTDLR